MLQLAQKEGLSSVELLCDVCLLPITDAGMAIVRWRGDEDLKSSTIRNLQFCHKGFCDKQGGEEQRYSSSWELGHFIGRLVVATGMADYIKRDIYSATGVVIEPEYEALELSVPTDEIDEVKERYGEDGWQFVREEEVEQDEQLGYEVVALHFRRPTSYIPHIEKAVQPPTE